MSSTSSINSNIPAAAASNLVPANMQINQADFLRLITAQLQQQNPLSPSDPTQFVTQLEGMSQVSSMQSMQSSLQTSALMNGTSLIGRSVLAPGATAALASGGNIGGAATAPPGATKLTVSVANASGAIVDSFNVTPAASGLTSFVWNGQTSTGTPAPAGTYSIKVNATVNGSSQPVAPMIVNKVESVLVDPSSQAIDLDTDGGSTIPLSSVVSVL